MRDSDWSRQILLRSDWLPTRVALITTIVVLRNWIKKTSKYYYVLFSCLKVCLLNSLRTCKREKKKVKRLERSIERNN